MAAMADELTGIKFTSLRYPWLGQSSFRAGLRFVPISSEGASERDEASSARLEEKFVFIPTLQIVEGLAGVPVAATGFQKSVVLGTQTVEAPFVRLVHQTHNLRQDSAQRNHGPHTPA